MLQLEESIARDTMLGARNIPRHGRGRIPADGDRDVLGRQLRAVRQRDRVGRGELRDRAEDGHFRLEECDFVKFIDFGEISRYPNSSHRFRSNAEHIDRAMF